eukprot:FR739009.1.p2 GENE.FR739009.1~~FR739009.1.p2  ORF type:complete len:131 (+),score=37.54 FR739009.1:810-1202(+)
MVLSLFPGQNGYPPPIPKNKTPRKPKRGNPGAGLNGVNLHSIYLGLVYLPPFPSWKTCCSPLDLRNCFIFRGEKGGLPIWRALFRSPPSLEPGSPRWGFGPRGGGVIRLSPPEGWGEDWVYFLPKKFLGG